MDSVASKASDIFVLALENENIQYIFGIPGEENLDLLNSLQNSKIKFILTRHEQAAGFMAATIGRLTGKAGVCMSTLGPGATNFATAAAYAQLAGFPMVMITGQKPIRKSKQGSFQIVNIVENMSSITKFTKQIADGDLIPSLVREAIRVAEEERPGAVHLELPEDIASTSTEARIFPVHPVRRPIANEKAIIKAVEMIEAATSPLLLIGAGANRKRTQKMLKQFVDKLSIPFVTTMMGKGVITESHDLYLGCCALSANDYVHICIEKADLIINMGHDVVEKPPFFMQHGKTPLVIHFNFYSAKVDKIYFPQLEVIGDIANAVWRLKERMRKQTHWNYSFMLQIKHESELHLAKGVNDPSFPMSPQRVVYDIREALPNDAIVCLDNGLYKIWFARCYKTFEPNTLLLDNALATMGAGLPSAIAVALLHPNKIVVAVCGDGGFLINSQEMETAIRLGLNITVVILNDNAYGMIKWKQNAQFKTFGLDLGNPNFVEYARSYGGKGYCVRSAEEFKGLLKKCVFGSPRGIKLIEVPIDYTSANQVLDHELPGIMKQKGKTRKPRISWALSQASGVPATVGDPTPADGACIPVGAAAAAEILSAPSLSRVDGQQRACSTEVSKVTSSSEHVDRHKILGIDVPSYPLYIANKPALPNLDLEVTNKYSGKVEARCPLAKACDIDTAISAAERALPAMAAMASYERKAVLEKVVSEVKQCSEKLASVICMETGKPIRDTQGEVQRFIDALTIAADECTRIYEESPPVDLSKQAKACQSVVRRFPVGTVTIISSFNTSLCQTAHKIGPALAVGCPFILKPASRTPVGALLLGEILSHCNLPEGAFSILPCAQAGVDMLIAAERTQLLYFTGCSKVGWELKAKAGKKKVVLELGIHAVCVVEDLIPHMETVANIIGHGAFDQNGQSYTNVKHVYIHVGNPIEKDVSIGPLIAESEAKRIESWVNKAIGNGAKLLAGAKRNGSFYYPTILEVMNREKKINIGEVSGPILLLSSYSSFKEIIHAINHLQFDLQVGVFVGDLNKAFYAFEHLHAGSVSINDVPTIEVYSQPCGKNSSRERLRRGMEIMTKRRAMLLQNIDLLQ